MDISKEEQKEVISEYMAKLGRKSSSRFKNMSKEEVSEYFRKVRSGKSPKVR